MDVPNLQQNIYVFGNNNDVRTSARDMYGAPPPPSPDSVRPVLLGASHRRLGKIAGGVALAAALVIGTLLSPGSLSRPSAWPEGKTALCRDGWYSPSLHRSGTCSNHGGVAYWRFPADDPLARP